MLGYLSGNLGAEDTQNRDMKLTEGDYYNDNNVRMVRCDTQKNITVKNIQIYVCACACVCVCVRESEKVTCSVTSRKRHT